MEHGVNDLFDRYELTLVGGIAKPEADLLTRVDVEAQKVGLLRVEFTQCANLPVSTTHDRFDEGGYLSKDQEGLGLPGAMSVMLILKDQRVDFTHRGGLKATIGLEIRNFPKEIHNVDSLIPRKKIVVYRMDLMRP